MAAKRCWNALGVRCNPTFLHYLAVFIDNAYLGKPISHIQPYRQFAPLGRGGNVRHASLLQIGPRARSCLGTSTVPRGGWPSHSISIVWPWSAPSTVFPYVRSLSFLTAFRRPLEIQRVEPHLFLAEVPKKDDAGQLPHRHNKVDRRMGQATANRVTSSSVASRCLWSARYPRARPALGGARRRPDRSRRRPLPRLLPQPPARGDRSAFGRRYRPRDRRARVAKMTPAGTLAGC